MNEEKLTVREMAYRYERYKKIVNEFEFLTQEQIQVIHDFMCNNWTPDNVHSLWNELFSKYPTTMEEEE